MKVHSLKKMPYALARDDGEAVKFQFVTHLGKTFEFECPPAAIPEILARMMSALEQAAKIKQPGPIVQAIRTLRCTTGVHREQGEVILTLYPSEHGGVSFALSPEMADQTSSELAALAAKLQPSHKPESLS